MLVYLLSVILYVANLAHVESFGRLSSDTPLDHQNDTVPGGLSLANTSRTLSAELDIKMFLTDYQPFAIIIKYLDQLVVSSDLAKCLVIGSSFEGRDLKVIQITAHTSRAVKPIIWLSGDSLGRDIAVVSTAINVAFSLINDYKSNANIKKLLNAFEFHIIPVANPDGYEYSRTVDPRWKKNRSKGTDSPCIGVDQNRNWKSHFKQLPITSVDPCLNNRAGPYAFSEIETHVISNYIYIRRNRIKMFATMFDTQQAWITPYAYTKKLPRNNRLLTAKAQVAVAAIAKFSNVVYKVESLGSIVTLSGASADWAFDTAGIPYSYGISLRNTTSDDKLPLKTSIEPIAKEIFVGFCAISVEILKEHLKDNLRNMITGCLCQSKWAARMIQ